MTHTFLVVIHLCISVSIYFVISITILVILSSSCNIFSLYHCVVIRRNLNYFSSAYTAAVSAVDPDAGNGELSIKVPSELWKQGDGE